MRVNPKHGPVIWGVLVFTLMLADLWAIGWLQVAAVIAFLGWELLTAFVVGEPFTEQMRDLVKLHRAEFTPVVLGLGLWVAWQVLEVAPGGQPLTEAVGFDLGVVLLLATFTAWWPIHVLRRVRNG